MTDQPAKPGRGLRLALGLSLALNLLFVGIVAGALLRDGPMSRAAAVRELGFGPFSEALTRDDRKALRQALFDRAPEMRDSRKRMRAEMAAFLGALRADPFDPATLSALMEDQRNRLAAQLVLGQEILADHIAAMTPAARADFADRLEHGLRHHDGGKDGGKEGDKDGD